MNISFNGIKPPYYAGKVFIYPIYKDLSVPEIDTYCKAIATSKKIGSGFNGDVFQLSKDFVIKCARPDALVNKSVIQEATKLDWLRDLEIELGIKFDNIQTGIAAFELPNGDSCLISSLVQGARPNAQTNPFNKSNLESLIKFLTVLDKGSAKDGRFMMYDMNLKNINVTKDKSGIFDFEYMQKESLEEAIKNRIINKLGIASSHVSDTSNLLSNIRSFEYSALYQYLREMPRNETKKFFKQYLSIKSKYHDDMYNHYRKLSKTSNYTNELLDVANSEKVHSILLAEPTDDILKAEAIKIQMAYFVFLSGKWCQDMSKKFNLEQITEYYIQGLKYFKDNLEKAVISKNSNKQIYYQNCINLFNGWNRILKLPEIMNELQRTRMTNKKIETIDKLL